MPVVEFDKAPHENTMEKIIALMNETEDTVFKKNLKQALNIIEECFTRLFIITSQKLGKIIKMGKKNTKQNKIVFYIFYKQCTTEIDRIYHT